MQYGLMPPKDYETMDAILGLVCNLFPDVVLHILEIGVHGGNGSRGIRDFIHSMDRELYHTGVDNQRDFKMPPPFRECNFIIGNSIEVYNQVPDNSQHFILIDGCHNYPMTMADFLVYSDKVCRHGIIAFHDTSPNIKPFQDFQGMGRKNDPDMYISCRKALNKLGLLEDKYDGWKLIMDEYDPSAPTGGIVAVQKRM